MDRQLNIPCGWSGSIHAFLSLPKQDWLPFTSITSGAWTARLMRASRPHGHIRFFTAKKYFHVGVREFFFQKFLQHQFFLIFLTIQKILWIFFLICRNFLKKFLEIFYVPQTFFENFSGFWNFFLNLWKLLKIFLWNFFPDVRTKVWKRCYCLYLAKYGHFPFFIFYLFTAHRAGLQFS